MSNESFNKKLEDLQDASRAERREAFNLFQCLADEMRKSLKDELITLVHEVILASGGVPVSPAAITQSLRDQGVSTTEPEVAEMVGRLVFNGALKVVAAED